MLSNFCVNCNFSFHIQLELNVDRLKVCFYMHTANKSIFTQVWPQYLKMRIGQMIQDIKLCNTFQWFPIFNFSQSFHHPRSGVGHIIINICHSSNIICVYDSHSRRLCEALLQSTFCQFSGVEFVCVLNTEKCGNCTFIVLLGGKLVLVFSNSIQYACSCKQLKKITASMVILF